MLVQINIVKNYSSKMVRPQGGWISNNTDWNKTMYEDFENLKINLLNNRWNFFKNPLFSNIQENIDGFISKFKG